MKKIMKSWAVALLAAVVLLSVLPIGVRAETCADGTHVPTQDIWKANYFPCDGGYKEDHYLCSVCYKTVDQNGYATNLQWYEGDGKHILTKTHPADYASCIGGFQEEYYLCEYGCDNAFDADGNYMVWYEPTAGHAMAHMVETAPTYETEGNREYWACQTCGGNFRDEEGTDFIYDLSEFVIPKLEKPQTQIRNGLEEVPQGVAGQYSTPEEIEKALVKAAMESGSTFIAGQTSYSFLNVTLQYQNADGQWETVSYESFPAEGVEIVLPYPEGTDGSEYDFVIAHMIADGENAGEIEILEGICAEDGIHVVFASLSPVMVMYQAKNAVHMPVNTPEETSTEISDKVATDVPDSSVALESGSRLWVTVVVAVVVVGGMVCLVLAAKKNSKKQ